MLLRRLVFTGLAAIYVVAAVFAIRWQIRERTWDPALEQYVAFVELERGLAFDHPVDVRWADISADLAADFAAERDNSDATSSTDPFLEAFALLGLIDVDADTRFQDQINETATEQAGAFYDPALEEIVLPIGIEPEGLGFTIVHELTHALQHQHGMLDWFLESRDTAATRRALVEGDAERIALAWFAQLTDAQRDGFLAAVDDQEPLATPGDPGNSFFEASFNASYVLGLPMVQILAETGGQKQIDDLLRADDVGTSERLVDTLSTSPTSTQVLDLPEEAEHPDGDVGAVTWFQAMAPTVGTREALEAIVGYDDDNFVVRTTDGRTCAWFGLSFDSESDADEFADVVRMMPAVESNNVTRTADRVVEIEVCAPIGEPTDQRLGTILPLVVAQEMTLFHIASGVSADAARCAGLAQAATIPGDGSADEFVGWAVVESNAPGFLNDCDPAVFSRR